VDQVTTELYRIKNLFTYLADIPAVYEEWERLVIRHAVKGKHSHDVRLIAAMKAHGLKKILTFDSDFSRYSEITVVAPENVSA